MDDNFDWKEFDKQAKLFFDASKRFDALDPELDNDDVHFDSEITGFFAALEIVKEIREGKIGMEFIATFTAQVEGMIEKYSIA